MTSEEIEQTYPTLAATREMFLEEFGHGEGERLHEEYANLFGAHGKGWAHEKENIHQNMIMWARMRGVYGNSGKRKVSAGNDSPRGGCSRWMDAGCSGVVTAILHTGSLIYRPVVVEVEYESLSDPSPSRSAVFGELKRINITPIDGTAARVS